MGTNMTRWQDKQICQYRESQTGGWLALQRSHLTEEGDFIELGFRGLLEGYYGGELIAWCDWEEFSREMLQQQQMALYPRVWSF